MAGGGEALSAGLARPGAETNASGGGYGCSPFAGAHLLARVSVSGVEFSLSTRWRGRGSGGQWYGRAFAAVFARITVLAMAREIQLRDLCLSPCAEAGVDVFYMGATDRAASRQWLARHSVLHGNSIDSFLELGVAELGLHRGPAAVAEIPMELSHPEGSRSDSRTSELMGG